MLADKSIDICVFPVLSLGGRAGDAMSEWVTVKTAAELRKCSERNILDLIKRGKLNAKRAEDGRRWLVEMDMSEDTPEETSEDLPNTSEVVSLLKSQMEEKDKQIAKLQEDLSEASQRHDTIVLQLTRQVEQSQRLLEYHQEPWWRRMFKKKRTPEM